MLRVELKKLTIIYLHIFPYNDDEMAWISKKPLNKTKKTTHNIVYTVFVALAAALFSTTIPAIIYFPKVNLL